MVTVKPKAVPASTKREIGDLRSSSLYSSTYLDSGSISGLDYPGDVANIYSNQKIDGNIYGPYYVQPQYGLGYGYESSEYDADIGQNDYLSEFSESYIPRSYNNYYAYGSRFGGLSRHSYYNKFGYNNRHV
ncbi:hypothetical protein TKK_0013602 [Trichogramma kaykai]